MEVRPKKAKSSQGFPGLVVRVVRAREAGFNSGSFQIFLVKDKTQKASFWGKKLSHCHELKSF